ncbi:MAG: hypothetical protein QXJ17_04490 [Nitrososphaeria archaeon]
MNHDALKLKKALLPIALMLVLCTPMVAYADQSTTVPICTNVRFENTGWTTKSYTVDVSKFSNAKQVMLHVTGKATGDSYVRYLVVIIDGVVVNKQTLDRKWDGATDGFTDVVSGQFDLKYDVTSLVKGKSSVTVKIGITTGVGSWDVSSEFIGAQGDNIVIPPNPVTTTSTSVPVSTASAVAGLGFLALGLYFKKKD